MDRLFHLLKISESGCMIGNFNAGVHSYAEDLLFICPSRSGLLEMLYIASKYARDHRISVSTDIHPKKSKTKGIVFSSNMILSQLRIDGNLLPWVENTLVTS